MKTIKTLIILFALTTVVCSCRKIESDVNESSKVDLKLIKEVRGISNLSTQRVAFQLLSAEEKYTIFIENIDYFIKNNNPDEAQLELLFDLRKNLSVAIFSKGELQDDFKVNYVPIWLNKALKVFDRATLVSIVARVRPLSSISRQVESMGSESDNCECNSSSFFTCGMHAANCEKSSKCTYSASGCGFLTIYECNGECID